MKNKRIFLAILICLFAVVFVGSKALTFIRTNIALSQKNLTLIKEIEKGYHSGAIYDKFGRGIIQYWEGILYFYDEKGEQKWNIYLGVKTPTIKASENIVYVMDKGLNQLIAIESGKVKYRYMAEGVLNNFEVCNNNYVLIKEEPQGHRTKLIVVNEEGREHSIIEVGEGRVINFAISKQHGLIAINSLLTNNSFESNLLTYDIKGELLSSMSLDGNIVLKFSYDEKGNLIIGKEEKIISLDKNNKELWETFTDKIKLFDVLDFNYMVVYSGVEGRNRLIHTEEGKNIKIIQYNGQKTNAAKINEEILGIDIYEDNIIAYSNRTIYKIDRKGNIIMEHRYHSDIEGVLGVSNNNIVVITKEKVSFIEVNGG